MPPHTVEGSGAENIPPQGESLLMTPHVRDDDVWKKDLCVEDFKPVKAVGNGDMGTVFLVVHESTNMPYAMKVMKKDALVSKNTTIRAQTEKDILSSLQHPFLPSLLATFESEKHSFLVMDYCTGGDLNVLRQRQPEKIFSVSAARFYAAEVVLALEYLHKKGILYRDLKPENILVQADGHIMLTDFDLSLRLSERKSFVKEVVRIPEKKNKKKQQRPPSQIKSLLVCGAGGNGKKAPKGNILSRVTPVEATNPRKGGGGGGNVQGQESEPRSNSFVGTVEYVAPEIIWGNGHSWQVDWWTLGVFLYEMVYGKTPFKSENGRKETFYNILTKTPEIPGPMSPLKDLLQKLLKKEPVERLGNNGVDEIKNHPFFEGVQWSALQYVSRPPCVPPPLVIAEVEAEIERKRAVHHEQSEGEIEREKMLKETFGVASTDGKTTTPDLEEAADPATFQQGESAIVSSMPAKELNGSSTMMEEQLQSASSIITSSVSWSGSEFVGSSRKIWSDTDGNQSSTEDESSLQVLKHMKWDSEPAEMIEYF